MELEAVVAARMTHQTHRNAIMREVVTEEREVTTEEAIMVEVITVVAVTMEVIMEVDMVDITEVVEILTEEIVVASQ
jgi:hypothetical protein